MCCFPNGAALRIVAPMNNCNVWDVVKVPFPYTNRRVHQYRPALVVAMDQGVNPLLLWVLMITSAENREWPGDIGITDLHAAGLPAVSMVRTAKIATIEQSAAERIGSLSMADRQQVTAAVRDRLAAAGICA